MIAILATLKCQEGKADEFEAVVKQLMAAVRANEPGNKVYQFARSRTEPNVYKVLEIYADQDAIATHRGAEHFRTLGRQMGAFMDGAPQVEVLDAVV